MQLLCINGHQFNYLITDYIDLKSWRCPHCNTKVAWFNTKDKIELEIKTPIKYITAANCKYKHDVEAPTYYIPK